MRPGIECRIKWPNDVWLEGRKLAGILIEAKPQDGWAVIGVGLNLSIAPDEFPPELRDTATSLFGSSAGRRGPPELPAVLRRAPPIPRHARALSRHLDRWVDADRDESSPSLARARRAARPRDLLGRAAQASPTAIDDRGDLLVVTAGGDRVALGAGEVHLRL